MTYTVSSGTLNPTQLNCSTNFQNFPDPIYPGSGHEMVVFVSIVSVCIIPG